MKSAAVLVLAINWLKTPTPPKPQPTFPNLGSGFVSCPRLCLMLETPFKMYTVPKWMTKPKPEPNPKPRFYRKSQELTCSMIGDSLTLMTFDMTPALTEGKRSRSGARRAWPTTKTGWPVNKPRQDTETVLYKIIEWPFCSVSLPLKTVYTSGNYSTSNGSLKRSCCYYKTMLETTPLK